MLFLILSSVIIGGWLVNQSPSIYESILKRKDGSRFFAELNAGIISYEGKPADLIIVRDINERKKAESKLRESESLYRILAEASDDLISVIDRKDG